MGLPSPSVAVIRAGSFEFNNSPAAQRFHVLGLTGLKRTFLRNRPTRIVHRRHRVQFFTRGARISRLIGLHIHDQHFGESEAPAKTPGGHGSAGLHGAYGRSILDGRK